MKLPCKICPEIIMEIFFTCQGEEKSGSHLTGGLDFCYETKHDRDGKEKNTE